MLVSAYFEEAPTGLGLLPDQSALSAVLTGSLAFVMVVLRTLSRDPRSWVVAIGCFVHDSSAFLIQ